LRLHRAIPRGDFGAADGDVHPLMELMLRRLAEGSARGARSDGAVVVLAIEGGGSCGVISGGMCLLLEKTGLINAVDVIYGTSSGALNGSFTAAGQAAVGSTNYLDVAGMRFANPLRALTGRAVIDFHYLFDELIRNRKPYDADGLAAGPSFRALGVDLSASTLQVLRDFADVEELTAAVRASCSLPLLAEAPAQFRGSPIADGSLIESIPYSAALAAEATHVLVLRSHTAEHRAEEYPRSLIEFVRRRAHPAVAPLMQERPARYNAEAERLRDVGAGDPCLVQIAPAATAPRVSALELSGQVVRDGLAAGAKAAAAAFGLAGVEVLWQPELYDTP
jgi:predicted patatin/cPLA2 family phospholipase